MVSKARIRLSSTDPQDINTICAEIKEIADKTGVKLKGPIPLPTKKLMVATRKSPAGQGTNTFDKWEMRIHKRLIDVNTNVRLLMSLMRIRASDDFFIEMWLVECPFHHLPYFDPSDDSFDYQ